MADEELPVRAATASDRPAVLALAGRALGWADDERDRDFFRWKHDENPLGPSPAWVACAGDDVVAFRTFLRWRFTSGKRQLEMVRAVDTATDPRHQGRGLFTRLTRHAVEELRGAGTAAVFNTPNEQSRPGYLKMGWHQLGRPAIAVRPSRLRTVPRLRQSRTAAQKWSEPCSVGDPAGELLADPSVAGLIGRLPSRPGWSTPRTPEYLQWRYRFEPLGYRAIEAGGGLVVFRVRRRGPAREVAVVEWLAPRPDRRALARLVRAAGDYAVMVGAGLRHGVVPLRGQGPVVTWRPLAHAAVPTLDDLALTLGDLELF